MERIIPVIFLLLSAAACRGEAPAPVTEGEIPPPPTPRRAAASAGEQAAAAAGEAEKVKEMLAAHKKKREILVGGCARRCRAPLDGFRGFARALWKLPDPDEPQPLLSFVDTAELVDRKTRRGRDWAQLFLDGRLAERREGIEEWRDGFVTEMGTLSEPAELQATLDAALDITRLSSDQLVIHFPLPATDRGAGGEVWHFTFGRRGLEWLLRRVERP